MVFDELSVKAKAVISGIHGLNWK